MVQIGDKITSYEILGESIVIIPQDRIIIVNNKKATFEYADKMVKEYRYVNVINKPIWVKLYSDWKNNKLTKDSYSNKEIITVEERHIEILNKM